MHDIRWIRENPDIFDKALIDRNLSPLSSHLIEKDSKRRASMSQLQNLQSRKNELALLIGIAKKEKKDTSGLEKEAVGIRTEINLIEADYDIINKELENALSSLPNILLNDVPIGKDENDNKCLRIVGVPPKFSFTPRPHYEIGESLKMIDFQNASKISGSRFVVLRKDIAMLERALKSFMLDVHTQKFGYEEISLPLLVDTKCMFGSGQLPKFSEESFQTTNGKWLIPTSEVPLVNMFRESMIEASDFPIRLTAYSNCFRSEAGAAGRDTRGMIRNHQFSKVELVSIVHPSQGEKELERMTSVAENILNDLGLAYRVMLLSTGDTGFASQKTYDIEVWLPSENTYREISSCSLCGDFQARRMSTRYKSESEKGFAFTLNGSGLAIGRTIVAILENYQLVDGSVTIPEVLVPYMNGKKEIKANGK